MGLTANQRETLHAIVKGALGGMLLKPIPSLVKRGLVVELVEKVFEPLPVPLGIRNRGQGRVVQRVVYRLTPAGLEEYTKLRTRWHQEQVGRLETEFQRELARAESLLAR